MLITQEELQKATGYTRPADIARCLRRQGIRVFRGRGGRVFAFAADFEASRQKKKRPNFDALEGTR